MCTAFGTQSSQVQPTLLPVDAIALTDSSDNVPIFARLSSPQLPAGYRECGSGPDHTLARGPVVKLSISAKGFTSLRRYENNASAIVGYCGVAVSRLEPPTANGLPIAKKP